MDEKPPQSKYKKLSPEEKEWLNRSVKKSLDEERVLRGGRNPVLNSSPTPEKATADLKEPQQVKENALSLKPSRGSIPTMNRKQKWVLICGLVLIVLAGLYPPWQFVLHGPQGISGSRSAGHSFSEPSYATYYHSMQRPIPCGEFSRPWSDGKCYESYADDKFYESNPSWIEAKVDFQILVVEWVTLTLVVCGLLWLWRPSPQK